MILNFIRNSMIYLIWGKIKECMSSAKLLKLIKNSLRCSNEVKSYSMIALQDSLKKKLPKRFPIARGLQKINVIAFGTNDWEQYGFWESFYQFADFYFYDYQ